MQTEPPALTVIGSHQVDRIWDASPAIPIGYNTCNSNINSHSHDTHYRVEGSSAEGLILKDYIVVTRTIQLPLDMCEMGMAAAQT